MSFFSRSRNRNRAPPQTEIQTQAQSGSFPELVGRSAQEAVAYISAKGTRRFMH